jgi:hypothetical protein
MFLGEFPTWQEIGVPEKVVKTIQELPYSTATDSLIHLIVFQNKQKIRYLYLCPDCGNNAEPRGNNEEVQVCEFCSKKNMLCSVGYSFSKSFSRYSKIPLDVLKKIQDLLFKKGKSGFPELGWQNNLCYCKMPGGDPVYDENPSIAIVKSSILCPWLWEDVEYYSEIINFLTNRWRTPWI